MLNWGETDLVVGSSTNETFPAFFFTFPEKIPSLDRGFHRGVSLPARRAGSRMQLGEQKAWNFDKSNEDRRSVNSSSGDNPLLFVVESCRSMSCLIAKDYRWVSTWEFQAIIAWNRILLAQFVTHPIFLSETQFWLCTLNPENDKPCPIALMHWRNKLEFCMWLQTWHAWIDALFVFEKDSNLYFPCTVSAASFTVCN